MARCFRNSVMEKALFIFCSNCVEYSYQDKQAVFTSLFNSISENFHILLLKSVLLTSVASFVLFAIDFSSVAFTTSSERLTKRGTAIFKLSAPAIIVWEWKQSDAHCRYIGRAHFALFRAQNPLWRVHLKSRFKLLMIRCSSPIVGFIYSVCRSLQLSPVVVHV